MTASRHLLLLIAVLMVLPVAAPGADAEAIASELTQALSSNSATDKREAVAKVRQIKDDTKAFALLLKAVRDRQARSAALKALQSRAGVSPRNRPDSHGKVGPGFPGHPTTSDAAGWSAWISKWKEEQAMEERIEKAEEVAEKAIEKAEEGEGPGEEEGEQSEDETTTGAAEAKSGPDERTGPVADVPKEDYGQLERIIFKDGGMLIGYILVRRVDLDGELTSIEVMHREGGGKEVLDADLIARIDEDFR